MIEAHNLSRRFGGFTAVSQVSLRVPDGTILALLGPNGAGKTTTVRMLSGLLAPTEGEATVAGYDIHREPDAVRARIGLVTDVPGLYEQMKVTAYLNHFGSIYGIPAAERTRRIDVLLELFELDTRRNEKMAGFSKGMKQKVMIIAALLAGRWTTAAGARWLLVAGCLLFAAGLLLTNVVINPNPAYLPLAAALGLAGVGIGTCVVPVTSSVLGAVPAERSGMAASATNTSREFGAVTGIAVLGAVVNAELRSGVVSRMTHLGASPALQQYVLNVIETGSASLPHGGSTGGNSPLDQIVQAGYAAFTSALHGALYLSAALLAGAALLSAVTLRQRRHAAESAYGEQAG